MVHQIIDWEQDEAGKWRYRVSIDGQTVMFKFDDLVDDSQVQAEAARYVAMREQANGPTDTE
jgi:hypothetical protein